MSRSWQDYIVSSAANQTTGYDRPKFEHARGSVQQSTTFPPFDFSILGPRSAKKVGKCKKYVCHQVSFDAKRKEGEATALTRAFRDTVKTTAEREPAFRIGLLEEALEAFLDADLATGKLLLRDYVNATVGFETLGTELDKNPKSLMRMLSQQGNPRADHLFCMVAHLKTREGVTLGIRGSRIRQTVD